MQYCQGRIVALNHEPFALSYERRQSWEAAPSVRVKIKSKGMQWWQMHPPGQTPNPSLTCPGPEQVQDRLCRDCTKWLPEDSEGIEEPGEGKCSSQEMKVTQVTG